MSWSEFPPAAGERKASHRRERFSGLRHGWRAKNTQTNRHLSRLPLFSISFFPVAGFVLVSCWWNFLSLSNFTTFFFPPPLMLLSHWSHLFHKPVPRKESVLKPNIQLIRLGKGFTLSLFFLLCFCEGSYKFIVHEDKQRQIRKN